MLAMTLCQGGGTKGREVDSVWQASDHCTQRCQVVPASKGVVIDCRGSDAGAEQGRVRAVVGLPKRVAMPSRHGGAIVNSAGLRSNGSHEESHYSLQARAALFPRPRPNSRPFGRSSGKLSPSNTTERERESLDIHHGVCRRLPELMQDMN